MSTGLEPSRLRAADTLGVAYSGLSSRPLRAVLSEAVYARFRSASF